MSGEMTAILGVGVALAGMILTSSRGLRQDIQQDIARLREDMKQYPIAWRGWSTVKRSSKDYARPSPDGLRPARVAWSAPPPL